ncbi:M23 family metallopeptidase [Lewinella cohaerens]|uniref:M23 family metallopeptidase n=1 Tax=Lewinella cohaerens TaxID=70995 RepID=UPI0005C66F3E|nr:M23 family metallopeptidase [Lewinella cohaerens]
MKSLLQRTNNNTQAMRQLCFWTIALLLFSQSATDSLPNFTAPVQGTIQLTGTFGELRGNHFHAGLDIRGAVGRPVYAIADGYISRIRVTVSGYGQALYVQHPNSGHTAVYGHLDRFRDDLMAFTRREQYKQESFLLDEELPQDSFPVRQGELIGYIGQRGYVSGPHLHFEIRDTETERSLNPMNFGITVPDSRQPQIRGLRFYQLSERGNVLSGKDYSVQGRGTGKYVLAVDTLYTDQPIIAFGIKAYDQQNGRPNLNGIYSLEMYQDSQLNFAYRMDHFLGEQTRYLNAHLDYEQQRKNNSWFQRAFVLPGNQLDFYETSERQGRIKLEPRQVSRIQFRISDHRNNTSTLELVVKRRENAVPLQNPVYTYYLPHDEENLIDDGRLRAHFPEGIFYEDVFLDYDLVEETSSGLYAPTHRIHSSLTPLHRYFDLHIRPVGLPEALKAKAIITQCDDGREPVSYGGEWTSEGRLRAPVRAFGNFTIMADTSPPEVLAERFSQNMKGWPRFSFKISDNFPTAGKARDLRFRAEVDGQWILMEYDGRKDRLYHDFDGRIPSGDHQLVLRVVDDRGNETVVERSFKN